MDEKKRINPIIKFRQYWKSLTVTERQLMWLILTALRGLDEGEYSTLENKLELKHQTTARIRGELVGKSLAGKTKESTGCFIEAEIRRPEFNVKKDFNHCPHHFKLHVRQAIDALIELRGKEKIPDLMKFKKEK